MGGTLSYDYPSYTLYGNTSAYGNVSRNSLRSYAIYQTDIGLHKAFQLWGEGSTLDFRAEAFNVLNKVNYQAPGRGDLRWRIRYDHVCVSGTSTSACVEADLLTLVNGEQVKG